MWTGFPEYTCLVFHPEEFDLQFGFEPFKFIGRLFSITFVEGTIQDELREREGEVRRTKLRMARLLKQLEQAKQQIIPLQVVHSAERSSPPEWK
ncbi:aldo/keto reductase [Sesbania bispinosa]|nr:aldo/keto reductase [Sesbania bispinosa]